MNGHACVDFKPGTYWLVFARVENGRLELVHDCEGAVSISSLLGSTVGDGEIVNQMEADFIAGLEDDDQAARIISIQRLGSLRSASSRPALHRIIERGSADEAEWAVFAALRSGDISVLAMVRDLLIREGSKIPGLYASFELCRLKEPGAVPGLIEIATPLHNLPPALVR
jgi:hypothetical protein